MGKIFSKSDPLKPPQRTKGPPRRPPSASSRSRRSANQQKATVVSKADLDSVTAEVETVLQNPNKNRAKRPQNRRPPARARQNRADGFLNEDQNKAPETDVSEVDAIHHRLTGNKSSNSPLNDVVEHSEYSNDTLSSMQKQRKLSKVFSVG